MLIREISDPRLKLIYVTDVKVDRELAYADVFVSAVEGVSRSADVLAGLESASGFIKRTLASRVELRAVSMSTGTGEVRRNCLSTSKPSMPGSMTSRMIACHGSARAVSKPSGPL